MMAEIKSSPANAQVKPFQINVPESILKDLQGRLKRTRWTSEPEDSGWGMGASLRYMKELADYWQHQYDWRKHEVALSIYP